MAIETVFRENIFDHITDLNGVAANWAEYLIDSLMNNDEFHGPGTFAGWEADFAMIVDALCGGFEGASDISCKEWIKIQRCVLAALEQLRVEEAATLDILKTTNPDWPYNRFPRSMIVRAQIEARSRFGLGA